MLSLLKKKLIIFTETLEYILDNGMMKPVRGFDQDERPGTRINRTLKQNKLRAPKRRTHVFSQFF